MVLLVWCTGPGASAATVSPRHGPRVPLGVLGHHWTGHHTASCRGRGALGEKLPQLHLQYCTDSWNDADGLERVQRRRRNIIKELEGMIYTASLKGLHNSNNNKRLQHIVFFIFVLKRR